MKSVVSYPDRGQYGNNKYRGNCSGRLIEDLIGQYKLQALSDYMVGGGTTEDVCKTLNIPGKYLALNRGYDMLSMDNHISPLQARNKVLAEYHLQDWCIEQIDIEIANEKK